jgi:hypothetical protein
MDVCSWTYQTDGIQLGDFSIETEALRDPAQFLGNVLGVACFGAIEDKGSPCLCARHTVLCNAISRGLWPLQIGMLIACALHD